MDRTQSRLDYDIPKDWTLLAVVDESESYEVDITEIWKRPDNLYALVTAAGCSCWEGDYHTEIHNSLEALSESMIQNDRQWNPSFVAAKELYETAKIEDANVSSN